jgi:hypothetical protein
MMENVKLQLEFLVSALKVLVKAHTTIFTLHMAGKTKTQLPLNQRLKNQLLSLKPLKLKTTHVKLRISSALTAIVEET